MTDLRYPVGRLSIPNPVTEEQRAQWIEEIASVPQQLRQALAGLTDVQLDTPYRPEGWTVRQVVHHLADSHINSYVRFRLALTEDAPTIKPYDEQKWANLTDAASAPPELSLALLDALHERWVTLLRSMSAADFARTFRHPEGGISTLERTLGVYAWHGRHHIAHITALRERMGW